MSENKTKHEKCRFCHHCMGPKHNEMHCVADGWADDKVKTVTEQDCENCEKYKSRYIEYPITVNGIENAKMDFTGLGHTAGCLCEIQPCGEEYQGKSFVGIYIGDLPTGIYTTFDEKTGIIKNSTINNPAILVPELGKIIYGCESWWREIKSLDDFKGITKEEIDNLWYVRLLSAMNEEVKGDET